MMVEAQIFDEFQIAEQKRTASANTRTLAAMSTAFAVGALFTDRLVGRRLATINVMLAAGCVACRAGSRCEARPAPPRPAIAPFASADLDFSIVIPVFNRPDHIRALLTSLADIRDVTECARSGEIIVVDDGSTDQTASVAAALTTAMPIPARVMSKPNGGVSEARNFGFRHARGATVVAIDSDCIPEPGWLTGLVRIVEHNPYSAAFARIRDDKRPMYPLENVPDRRGFVTASFAMNRDRYLAIGGFDERFRGHDDHDFLLSCHAAGIRIYHASDAWIAHPVRYETFRSAWKNGMLGRYSNLLVSVHGERANFALRPTPYYYYGVGGTHGSSLAMMVVLINALAAAVDATTSTNGRRTVWPLARLLLVFGLLHVLALTALGLRVGARPRQLPKYVATLTVFQTATLVGRVKGSALDRTLLL